MRNVTDTLYMVLDRLGELQHDCDDLGDKIGKATELRADSYDTIIEAFSQVAGVIKHVRWAAEEELKLIDRESSLSRFEQCCECGAGFERIYFGGRLKVYCSSRCRMRAYRARAAQRTE
jgi:hypothetical protein